MWIDAHQHFWVFRPEVYPWIRNGILARDYLPDDLKPLLVEAGFSGTIVVQAQAVLDEARWLLSLADAHPFIKGVVGWVDLEATGAREHLMALAQHPSFRGVRYPMHVVDPEGVCFSAAFLEGIRAVGDLGLIYELLLAPSQLPSALVLARAFPEQSFVLDHLGNPDIRGGKLEPWAEAIRHLATQPNVYCKLSGMVTRADHTHWMPEDFYPFLDVVVSAFGCERLMIGSDWPVCRQAGEYGPVMRIVIDYLKQFSEGIQQAVLGSNAVRIYGLTG